MAAASTNSSAQGSITVTCSVSASVGLIAGSDGELHIVVANGVDPADTVSSFQYVQLKKPDYPDKAKANLRKERDPQGPAGTSPR